MTSWSLALFAQCALLGSAPARALPPLQTFVEAARSRNFDNREAHHRAAQAEQESNVQRGAVLPYVTSQARYQRNQYQVEFNFPLGAGTVPFNVAPRNQYDVIFTLGVPVIDSAGWARTAASKKLAEAAAADKEATALEVERQVLQSYYGFAAALAVVDAANTAREAARENVRIAQAQQSAEAVPMLDVQRATAEFAAVEEALANAELQRELARRRLATLTGVQADDSVGTQLPDPDLTEEEPLATWERRAGLTPSVRSAVASARADEAQARAAKLMLAPSIEASAQEHFTNATAFTRGHSPYYTLMGTANWRVDFRGVAGIRSQNEAAAGARVREERARTEASDAVHRAWWTVHADIAQVTAAKARAEAAGAALASAKVRYAEGAGTQLDALQAVRDAANADVARIQANANLSVARAELRLATGQSLADKRAK